MSCCLAFYQYIGGGNDLSITAPPDDGGAVNLLLVGDLECTGSLKSAGFQVALPSRFNVA